MRLWMIALGAAALALPGCALLTEPSGPEEAAGNRIRLADSLEHEGKFLGAALQYSAAAEEYPQSSYYPTAVRRAALMYSISPYSAGNDSAAYRWYLAYLALPLKKAERENVRVSVELLHRILLLHAQISQIYTATDSLTVVTKRQSAQLNADGHRMQGLELDLQRAQAELKKIKEMDLRLSKSRVR
jgi:hypothetical protein